MTEICDVTAINSLLRSTEPKCPEKEAVCHTISSRKEIIHSFKTEEEAGE